MSFTLNRITLIGSLGKDCEVKTLNKNSTVTKFSIATARSVQQQDKTWKEYTTWHNITAFNQNKNLTDQLTKGTKIFIEGRQENSTYTDKDGNKKNNSEVIAEKIILFNTKEN